MEKKLVAIIKQKPELANLPDSFVEEQLRRYAQSHAKEMKMLLQNYNPRSALFRKIVKVVRAALRRSIGLFEKARKIKLSGSLQEQVGQLLSTHSSTRERLPFYPQLMQKISEVIKPTTILDLGCGLHPLAIIFFPGKVEDYRAYDINERDVALINTFFRKMKVPGKAAVADISKITEEQLPQADLAFLLKVTDIVDQGKGHKKTEELLKIIPAKYVLVSFSTKTMSGRKMTAPRRRWMEWLCKRLQYGYEIWQFENEIFYVVRKE